jgi:hypothetical protein
MGCYRSVPCDFTLGTGVQQHRRCAMPDQPTQTIRKEGHQMRCDWKGIAVAVLVAVATVLVEQMTKPARRSRSR